MNLHKIYDIDLAEKTLGGREWPFRAVRLPEDVNLRKHAALAFDDLAAETYATIVASGGYSRGKA